MSDIRWSSANIRSSHVSDALDNLGYRNQTIPLDIPPLNKDWVAIGRAYPMRAQDDPTDRSRDSRGLIEAVIAIPEGSVVVIDANIASCAIWGEIVSAAAEEGGAAGVVCTGSVRDGAILRQRSLPVFASSTRPNRAFGRADIVAHGVPVTVAGVTIGPGDIIVADSDGVVAVPAEVEQEVLAKALEIASAEARIVAAIHNGQPLMQALTPAS